MNGTHVQMEGVQSIGNVLVDTKRPLKERFRALFTLRNIGGKDAIDCINACFSDESALLKHECAYCLGQMQDEYAIPKLSSVLEDKSENTMVRHEAAEALGAIGSLDVIETLKHYLTDPAVEVAETCELALARIEWVNKEEKEKIQSENPYASVDPAPPSGLQDIKILQESLLGENQQLFTRYRAMFTLRNIGGPEAVCALAKGLRCKSALFRHEIAYVLGQMQHPEATQALQNNLADTAENPMVRHECAEALGAIASDSAMDSLKGYTEDEEVVVKESCEVALDMCEYENSKEFQYADALQKVNSQPTIISDVS